MRTIYLLLLILGCALTAIAQEAGNRQYGGAGDRRASPSNVIFGIENKNLIPAQYIEAYVLLNSAPDEFVAVVGVAQEAPTAAESNLKVNAQLDRLLKGAIHTVFESQICFGAVTRNRPFGVWSKYKDRIVWDEQARCFKVA